MKDKLNEYEALKKKALEQFRQGKHLLGKDGAFQPLLKEFLESALEAEATEHLDLETSDRMAIVGTAQAKSFLRPAMGALNLKHPVIAMEPLNRRL
jgi:hypothetical protein